MLPFSVAAIAIPKAVWKKMTMEPNPALTFVKSFAFCPIGTIDLVSLSTIERELNRNTKIGATRTVMKGAKRRTSAISSEV